MNSVTDLVSFTGSVFGMQAMEVKPPAAAARLPVRTVSLYSNPGSRGWVCMSINPGTTSFPSSSRMVRSDSPPALIRSFPRLTIVLPSMRRSTWPSSCWDGSMILPPLRRTLILAPCQQVEEGHPHRYPVGNLVENHRKRPIGHVGRDLHPAVHRPRMHDDHVVLGQFDVFPVEAEIGGVLANRRGDLLL